MMGIDLLETEEMEDEEELLDSDDDGLPDADSVINHKHYCPRRAIEILFEQKQLSQDLQDYFN